MKWLRDVILLFLFIATKFAVLAALQRLYCESYVSVKRNAEVDFVVEAHLQGYNCFVYVIVNV